MSKLDLHKVSLSVSISTAASIMEPQIILFINPRVLKYHHLSEQTQWVFHWTGVLLHQQRCGKSTHATAHTGSFIAYSIAVVLVIILSSSLPKLHHFSSLNKFAVEHSKIIFVSCSLGRGISVRPKYKVLKNDDTYIIWIGWLLL